MKNSEKMQEMFVNMVIKKNSELIKQYYHKDFKLYANGIEQSYEDFVAGHEKIYNTNIQYKVDIDHETITEGGNKVALRVFITTSMPDAKPTEIEVILIASYKEGKIYRLWELTRPDWSQIETFKENYMDKTNQ